MVAVTALQPKYVVDQGVTNVTVDKSSNNNYPTGLELGYAESSTIFTTTSAAYPGVIVPGVGVIVIGNGRPVDIEYYVPGVWHSVANTGVTLLPVVNSAALTNYGSIATAYSPSTTAGPAVFIKRRVILDAGVSFTFYLYVYAAAAGTTTLTAATFAPISLSVTSR